ncbi:MAG: hypothetical protein QW112_02680 [Candidatus Micrarchaeia archaeon]
MKLPNIYEGDYSRLIVLPLALIFISIIVLLFISPIKYGLDLKGGTLITLQLTQPADEAAIRDALSAVGQESVSVKLYSNPAGEVAEIEMATDERIRAIDEEMDAFDKKLKEVEQIEIELAEQRGKYATDPKPEAAERIRQLEADFETRTNELISIAKSIESSARSLGVMDSLSGSKESRVLKNEVTELSLSAKDKYKENIMGALRGVTKYSTYSVEQISPVLSRFFIDKVIQMAVFSAILAFIIIFIIFRQPLPCLIVASGAVADIIMSMGAMGLFGIPLSLPSFAALMMMAGLSLDTDMMLTIKTLKRTEGTPRERAYEAFRTGFAMTTTTFAGFGMLFLLGLVTHISAYYQIGAIGVVGLIGDLIMTWCFNAVLVLWYSEGKLPKIFKFKK